jgi:BASS family bile acid:Na+ symporter
VIASAPTRLAGAIEDYLLGWVLLSVAVGFLVPDLAALAPLSTPILAVMIGSVSLTLSPGTFRQVRPRALVTILAVQTGMALAAFGIARALSLSPALTLGFVVLGAVTPELVAPTMTDLAGGDTALAAVVLVVVGLGSVAVVPTVVGLLVGGIEIDAGRIIEGLLLAVVGPMILAVLARARFSDRVGRYDDYYPSVSALMVVLVIGIVTAANASLLRSSSSLLLVVGVGAAALNAVGYAAGWLAGSAFSRAERIAALFSVGTRDFAVAAGLVVAAGFPAAASLPAVTFGVVEMASSAALARTFSARSEDDPGEGME